MLQHRPKPTKMPKEKQEKQRNTGRKQCLRLLLEAGAEMGKRMISGETPLGLACSDEVKDLFFTTKPPHSLLRRLHSP
ncbi:hypothetical protein AK812_SmicGene18598 [Symbiodinium microadriaticum]|uniref:Uncharacterized protein n=1 Tax=Symbiodinium microadriaticum TaxID=2951 RepID=A0A1Q9DUS6_SYMMI|nr:hypothetical protein AK812_SmicGene18598 [Symbiodinium microadriaticum]